MKKVLHIALLALLMAAGQSALAQLKIPNTNTTFNFPNSGWKYLKTIDVSKDATIYLYCYSERYIIDETGDTILPYMRIFVHRHYSESPYDMAYERYSQQPFQSIAEFVEGLPSDDGIGYIGAYTNALNDKDYQFRMIYFKDGDTGIEIRLETTRDTYEEMAREFEDIIKTVKINR